VIPAKQLLQELEEQLLVSVLMLSTETPPGLLGVQYLEWMKTKKFETKSISLPTTWLLQILIFNQ